MNHPVKTNETIDLQPANVETIAAWLATAWGTIGGKDAAERIRENGRGLGSDDCPHLSLVEKTHTASAERAYGPWGCSREVRWEMRGKPGDPVDVADLCRHTAEFCVKFGAQNGRFALSLRAPMGASEWKAFEAPKE